MKKLAFIFQTAPYGSNQGREGLDMVIALSVAFSEIALFFVDSGLLQLLCDQEPEAIGMKNYTKAYGMLSYCDIEQLYVSERALQRFNLSISDLLQPVHPLADQEIAQLLSQYDAVITV